MKVRNLNSVAGFTLAELCLVLGVLGLLFSAGVASARALQLGAVWRGIRRAEMAFAAAAERAVLSGTSAEISAADVRKLLLFPAELKLFRFGNLTGESAELRPDSTASAGSLTISDGRRTCRLTLSVAGGRKVSCN